MLRKSYQEKFFGSKKDNINYDFKEIEDEFSLISELFTELNREVINKQKSIDVIDDYINTTKNNVEVSETIELQEANKEEFNKYKSKLASSLVGAGLGSLVAIYNPYVAIGGVIVGGLTGWWLF